MTSQHPEWYKSAVFYELSVRTFQDSNGDGKGDFPGLTSRLDYLKSLGVDVLWLGHFDLWTQEGLVMFRHALLLNGAVVTPGQCEAMLRAAGTRAVLSAVRASRPWERAQATAA